MFTELFTRWRAEIEAELTEARGNLESANAELAAAAAAARDAAIERGAIGETFDRLGQRTNVANALTARRRRRDEQLKAAEGRLVRARQVVKHAHLGLEDLLEAQAQLSDIAPEESATAAPVAA